MSASGSDIQRSWVLRLEATKLAAVGLLQLAIGLTFLGVFVVYIAYSAEMSLWTYLVRVLKSLLGADSTPGERSGGFLLVSLDVIGISLTALSIGNLKRAARARHWAGSYAPGGPSGPFSWMAATMMTTLLTILAGAVVYHFNNDPAFQKQVYSTLRFSWHVVRILLGA